jgi:hypothetical protein
MKGHDNARKAAVLRKCGWADDNLNYLSVRQVSNVSFYLYSYEALS